MKWISVNDRLPPIRKPVWAFSLDYDDESPFIAARMNKQRWAGLQDSWAYRSGKWKMYSEPESLYQDEYKITHWMPLPEPPK